jgi:hypothetical protein
VLTRPRHFANQPFEAIERELLFDEIFRRDGSPRGETCAFSSPANEPYRRFGREFWRDSALFTYEEKERLAVSSLARSLPICCLGRARTEGDESSQRPSSTRPQDSIPAHQAVRSECQIFDASNLVVRLAALVEQARATNNSDCWRWLTAPLSPHPSRIYRTR